MKPEEIRTHYSPEVIAILQDVYITEKLKRCQELRDKFPKLKKIPDIQIIDYALRMYINQKLRILRNKNKEKRKEK